MRFLLDQDVYAATAAFLKAAGHDVVTVSEIGLAQAADEEILDRAHASDRILVTRDRDFGALVFLGQRRAGVVYLRLTPSTLRSAHEELARTLRQHPETELQRALATIEPGRHRFRRLPN